MATASTLALYSESSSSVAAMPAAGSDDATMPATPPAAGACPSEEELPREDPEDVDL